MRTYVGILYLKRSLLTMLMTVVSIFTFHLSMAGETVDSLYRVYHNTDKAHQFEVVNQMAKVLHEREITDTLYHCTASTPTATVEMMFHYLMAEHYYDQELYESAIEEGKKAQAQTQQPNLDKLSSDLLGIISNAQFRAGDYDKALKTLLEAYQLDKKLDDKELISSDLNSLAAIYLAVGQPAPGIPYIEKSIEMEREMGRQDRLATRLGIASELYLLNNELDKAMEAIDEAYELDLKNGHEEKVAIRLVQQGSILEAMSKLNEARKVIMHALPVLEKADNTYSLAVAHNQLGTIEEKSGNTEAATAHFKKALELSIRCGSPKAERTAERGLWSTMRKSNPNIALLHLERYTILTDSMHKKLSAVQMKVMEMTAFNTEQADLTKKSERFSKLLKWGGFALVFLLSVMIGGLFFSWRRGQKTLYIQRHTQEKQAFFFSNITNELQAPLTVVMAAGQQLLEEKRTSTEENKRLGEMIVRHGKNMLGLVNQLFSIEQVRKEFAPPDAREGDIVLFVRLLVDNYTTVANQHLINLEFSSPVKTMTVSFATNYLRKIVHGLLANAIKFTPRNGTVTVALDSTDNSKIRLTVSDTGKGIPIEERERLFDPFTQSDNGDNGVETSVNLSLVNQLVQSLNGTITVDSELGRGTMFTIELPIQAVNRASAGTFDMANKRISNADVNKQKPLVFIVENDEDVAYFVANQLREDYELRFAHDGQEALNNASELVPALIITSIKMPVMDGKELMRRLRHNPTLSHTAIIAMTSISTESERLSCLEAGADAVIVKPFISDELKLHTRNLIRQTARIREQLLKTSTDTVQHNDTTAMSKEDKAFINRLVDVIHAQLAQDDIDMEHIAAAMSLSRKQLRSRVMAITGVTPVAYILQVRLNYARRMISSENTSLTAIATKCGFQNLSHFSKAFKQQFGISPMQYRKSAVGTGPNLPPQN